MRGLFILSALLVATPSWAAEKPVRVVEKVPAAKVQVVEAVATVPPVVKMETVVRCDAGMCTSTSTKTATSSAVIRTER